MSLHTWPQDDLSGHRAVLPSWVVSVVMHTVMVLVLGWLLQGSPRGAAEEPGREVGIVLKRMTEQGELYEGEDSQAQPTDMAPVDTAEEALASLPTDAAQLDPTDALPAAPAIIGAGALEDGGVGDAGDLTQGAQQPKAVRGGQASVQVYGVEGEGSKFIYVFDRSVSMSGAPLASAKAQLLKSLGSLESVHQFQIIFFNHDRRVFDLSGGQNRIPFATDRAKQLARSFVGGITADGGTNRYAALNLAVGMKPDVIFFLTDADEPMSRAEVEQIRRKNRGIASINTIEFGYGPTSGEDNFLNRLARENSGNFVYVDTSKLER